MKNNLKYIVYCTTCVDNNKIYIGVHKTDPNTFDGYIGCGVYIHNIETYQRSRTKFHYAVKKHGYKKFIRNTIAVFDDAEDAYNLEASIVNEQFLSRSDVYNMTLGGIQNKSFTTAKKVFQYDNNGNFIKEYNSKNEASKRINGFMWNIYTAIKNKTKYKGYYWLDIKFDKLDMSKMHKYEGHQKIPIFQYDEQGEYECTYVDSTTACNILKIDRRNLSKAIKLGLQLKSKYYTTEFCTKYQQARKNYIYNHPVFQYSLDGKYIKEFKNMHQANIEIKCTSSISRAIVLNRPCGGFLWSYEKLETVPKVETNKREARKVGKFSIDNKLIKEYPTVKACKEENGASCIHVLQGRNKTSKGYIYKYID